MIVLIMPLFILACLDSVPAYLGWLKNLSFFNYALEALLVNELVYLQLTEVRFGLNIDVSYYCFDSLSSLIMALRLVHSSSLGSNRNS